MIHTSLYPNLQEVEGELHNNNNNLSLIFYWLISIFFQFQMKRECFSLVFHTYIKICIKL